MTMGRNMPQWSRVGLGCGVQEAFPRHYSHVPPTDLSPDLARGLGAQERQAFFSALTPGSHIVKHFGPSNRMLRVWPESKLSCQLCLVVEVQLAVLDMEKVPVNCQSKSQAPTLWL